MIRFISYIKQLADVLFIFDTLNGFIDSPELLK